MDKVNRERVDEDLELIALTELDIELISLITGTLDIQDFLRFTSTCKAFRELITRDSIKRLFTRRLRFQRLKIPCQIDKVKAAIESNHICCMECCYIELDERHGDNVFVVKDSLVHEELLKKGYTSSKVIIRTYIEFFSNSSGEEDAIINYIEEVHPRPLNIFVPIKGSMNYEVYSSSDNPLVDLFGFEVSNRTVGLFTLIKDIDHSLINSILQGDIPMSRVSDCEISFCILTDLVFMYAGEVDDSIEEVLAETSIKISNILKSYS